MSHVLHRTRSAPAAAVSGEGIYLRLSDGREIIDGSGGAAVACLGHGNRRVAEAIAAQAQRMAYAHTGFFTSEPAEALADLLLDGNPGGLSHAYFCSSGSEGTEAALKLARQYFVERGEGQRQHFIARRQSYHGTTLGALAAGGNMMRRAPYAPILAEAFITSRPASPIASRRAARAMPTTSAALADELEASSSASAPIRVAAFIAEPVVGATAGCVPALPGYFEAVRAVCDRHGALLILDEVMCGMGRTGTQHAWEQEGVAPDIQVIAKGLGGGYQPIGGILIAAAHRRGDPRRLRRLHARPDLSGASGRLRRGAGGAARDPRGRSDRQRARDGRAAGGWPDGALRQSPPCRRHPRARPVLGAGVRRRSRHASASSIRR